VHATAQPPRTVDGDGVSVHYVRHRPERTTLYRVVEQYAQSFFAQAEETTGAILPQFVLDEFDACASHAVAATSR
jgi:hypothetical protein